MPIALHENILNSYDNDELTRHLRTHAGDDPVILNLCNRIDDAQCDCSELENTGEGNEISDAALADVTDTIDEMLAQTKDLLKGIQRIRDRLNLAKGE